MKADLTIANKIMPVVARKIVAPNVLSQKLRLLIGSCLITIGLCTFNSVSAQSLGGVEPQYDVYQLSAEAQVDVANDLMSVNLVAQATGSDSAELANKINATMGWALAKLKAYPRIDSRTLDYQTYPQYERNGSRIKGWVASQSVRLESDDFEQTSKAIQLLQERMQVQGMQLTAKPETRKKAEDQLINTALDAFKQRALLVQTNMGAPAYRVMNLSINTSGSRAHYRAQDNYRAESLEMAVGSAPAIEAGTSTVTVHINGQIQLE